MIRIMASLFCALALISGTGAGETKIVSIGSDTMSHLMKNTAEAFKVIHPDVTVEVQEPGSSAGVGAMINGLSDLCPSSRSIKKEEIEKCVEKHGAPPIEIRVALDGIVIYVHKDNPINELSMDQICRIFAQNPNDEVKDKKGEKVIGKPVGPKISTWGEVDATLPSDWKSAKITLYSRNAASGTYAFFKEHALTNHDYDKNCQEMPGTSSVVNGVAKDKFAIGYGGIGYKTNDVKTVAVAAKAGDPAVAPSVESVVQKKYPISRALQIYVPKPPQGMVKEYLKFIVSEEGQKIVGGEKVGFVPLPDPLRLKELEKLK